MSNPYGVTLDRAWTEWAAKGGVSRTVAAAVSLISQRLPAQGVVPKLTAEEFKRVIDVVRRWPTHFPGGTLAALEGQRRARPEFESKLAGGTKPVTWGGRTHERRLDGVRVRTPQTAPRPERASVAEAQRAVTTAKVGTHPGTLADLVRRRMIVDDLGGLGLSIRSIAAATGIPRSSVHRAVRSIARARAKQEADTAQIMRKLLGKRLNR